MLESERRPELQPNFITLSRDLYPEDTIGHAYFPEILEGRDRPDDFADSRISAGKKTNQLLANQGLETLSDLYHMTEDQYAALPIRYRYHVEKELDRQTRNMAKRQMITPSGRLISAVFGKISGPVEPEDEPKLLNAVEAVLESPALSDNQRKVLRLRFGLDDWQNHTLEEIAREMGDVTREKVRQIESRALANLRHPVPASESDKLRSFMALPLHSIGRAVGITYYDDLPNLPIPLDEIGLSEAVLDELAQIRSFELDYFVRGSLHDNNIWLDSGRDLNEDYLFEHFNKFMTANLDLPLSNNTVNELNHKLQVIQRKYAPYNTFGDLLPEVSSTYSRTEVVRNMPVEDLNLTFAAADELRQFRFYNLGSLLNVVHVEGEVPFSDETFREIGSKATKMSLYLGEIIDKV